MANALYDLYRERGLVLIHVIIEDGNGDGKIDAADAKLWQTRNGWNLKFPVIADTDRKIWDAYKEPCGSDILCQYGCYVTPQYHIIDQGMVTIDDGCSRGTSTTCQKCGYDEAHVKKVLDTILGSATSGCGGNTP